MTELATGALPQTGVWELEPRHSSVRFRIAHHAVTTFRSGFGEIHGSYDADARRLTGAAKVDSLQTFEMLRDRLFEEDFFDAANYPEVSFESTSLQTDGSGLNVEGNFTMKGVTRPVRAAGTVTDTVQVFHYRTETTHEHVGVDLELTIDRRDFGVSFNNELPDGRLNLGWDVTVELALEFFRTDPVE